MDIHPVESQSETSRLGDCHPSNSEKQVRIFVYYLSKTLITPCTHTQLWVNEVAELTTEKLNPALHSLWWLGVFDVF